MSEKRTVLVGEISYRGTDGEDHLARRGDVITVAKEGLEHFDWIHDATPEAQQAVRDKAAAEAERKQSTKPVQKTAEPKASAE